MKRWQLPCSYDKAEKAKLQAKKKAALERLEKGEAAGSDSEDQDDDKIDETEEAGEIHSFRLKDDIACISIPVETILIESKV